MASSSIAFHTTSSSDQPYQTRSHDLRFPFPFPRNSPPPLRLSPPAPPSPPPFPPHLANPPPPPPPRHLPRPPPPPHILPATPPPHPPPPHVLHPPPPPHPQPHPPFSPPPPPHNHTIIIIGICVGGVFFLTFLLYLICCFLRRRKSSKPQPPVCPSTEIVEESIEQVTVVKVEEKIEDIMPGGHHEIIAVSVEESESIRIQETVHEVNAATQFSSATDNKNTSEIQSEDTTATTIKEEEADLFDIQPFK